MHFSRTKRMTKVISSASKIFPGFYNIKCSNMYYLRLYGSALHMRSAFVAIFSFFPSFFQVAGKKLKREKWEILNLVRDLQSTSGL